MICHYAQENKDDTCTIRGDQDQSADDGCSQKWTKTLCTCGLPIPHAPLTSYPLEPMQDTSMLYKSVEMPDRDIQFDEFLNLMGQRPTEGYCEKLLSSMAEDISNEEICGGPNSPTLTYLRVSFPVGTKQSTYVFNVTASYQRGMILIDGKQGLTNHATGEWTYNWEYTVNTTFDPGMHYVEIYGMNKKGKEGDFNFEFQVGIETVWSPYLPATEANFNLFKDPIDTAPNATTSVNISVVDDGSGSTSYNVTLDCALWFDGENDYVSIPGPKPSNYNDDECIADRPSWGSDYNCGNVEGWCDDDKWKKDVRECCPCTCSPDSCNVLVH